MCIGCDILAEGRTARIQGKSMADCPYMVMGPFGHIWIQGWLEEDGDHIEVATALELQTRRERA